jgi:Flp pilus assembly protein TadG
VEFALLLPVLLALVTAIAEFGLAFNRYITLTDAVRAGARVGAVSGAGSTATVRDAVRSSASGLTLADSQIGVTYSPDGTDVSVSAQMTTPISIFGLDITQITLSSSTTERVEQ